MPGITKNIAAEVAILRLVGLWEPPCILTIFVTFIIGFVSS